MVGVGPAAADVDGADVAVVPPGSLLWLLWYTLELDVSLVCCRCKLMAWLVWGPLLLMLTVLMLPWFLSGSLLWLLWYT